MGQERLYLFDKWLASPFDKGLVFNNAGSGKDGRTSGGEAIPLLTGKYPSPQRSGNLLRSYISIFSGTALPCQARTTPDSR